MERPYRSIEEQLDVEYECELEGREALGLPWVSREEFEGIRAARYAALPAADDTDTDDDLPF